MTEKQCNLKATSAHHSDSESGRYRTRFWTNGTVIGICYLNVNVAVTPSAGDDAAPARLSSQHVSVRVRRCGLTLANRMKTWLNAVTNNTLMKMSMK